MQMQASLTPAHNPTRCPDGFHLVPAQTIAEPQMHQHGGISNVRTASCSRAARAEPRALPGPPRLTPMCACTVTPRDKGDSRRRLCDAGASVTSC